MKKGEPTRLDALEALVAEKRKHEGYLAKLDERREGTPEHVYNRLRDEYLTKLTDAQVKAQMEAEFLKHLKAVKYWLARQPNLQVLYVDYNALLNAPEEGCRRVAEFLDMSLDVEKMRAVPDGRLYRNRTS